MRVKDDMDVDIGFVCSEGDLWYWEARVANQEIGGGHSDNIVDAIDEVRKVAALWGEYSKMKSAV